MEQLKLGHDDDDRRKKIELTYLLVLPNSSFNNFNKYQKGH
jgi:hypothetical protein